MATLEKEYNFHQNDQSSKAKEDVIPKSGFQCRLSVPLWVFLLSFLVLVIALWSVGFAVQTVTYSEVQDEIILELAISSTEVFKQQIRKFFALPAAVLTTGGRLVERGGAHHNFTNTGLLMRHLWSIYLSDPSMIGVYIGLVDGTFFGYLEIEEEFYACHNIQDHGQLKFFNIIDKTTGEHEPEMVFDSPFDPFGLWYQTGTSGRDPSWTPVYFVGDLDVTLWISVLFPMWNNNNAQAFLGIDYSAQFLDTLFQRHSLSENSLSLLVEQPSGLLVADSTPNANFGEEDGDYYLLFPNQTRDPFIVEVSMEIGKRGLDNPNLKGEHTFRFNSDHQGDTFVNADMIVGPLGETFLLITALPISDFVGRSQQAFEVSLGIFIGLAVAMILIVVMASLALILPLRKLSKQMGNVAEMNLEGLKTPRFLLFSEIRNINDSFFSMVDHLHSFRRFLPETLFQKAVNNSNSYEESSQVSTDLTSSDIPLKTKIQYQETMSATEQETSLFDLGLWVRDMTVIALRLADFDRACNISDPEEIVRMHGEVLQVFNSLTASNKGVFSGSSHHTMYASWNTLTPSKKHAHHACQTALSLKAALEELQNDWESDGLPQWKMCIGVASGRGWCGNLGNEKAREFHVIGEPAYKSRLMTFVGEDCGASLVVDNVVHPKFKRHGIMRPVELLEMSTGFRDEPLSLIAYELLSKKESNHDEWMYQMAQDDQEVALRKFSTAFQDMLLNRWKEAKVKFDQIESMERSKASTDTLIMGKSKFYTKFLELCEQENERLARGESTSAYSGVKVQYWAAVA